MTISLDDSGVFIRIHIIEGDQETDDIFVPMAL